MQDISVLNKEVDLNCTGNFRLSIQITLNGFSFGINNDVKKEYIVLKYCPFDNNRAEYLIDNIKLVLSMNPLLSKKYKSSRILVDNEKKTIVPKDFFNEESISDVFSLSNNIDSDETLLFNTINDKVVIFAVNKELEQFLRVNFSACKIISSACPLLYYAMNKKDEYTSLVINKFSDKFFDLIICKNDNLLLANTYKFVKDIDIAYFTLNSLKRLDISNKNCKIIFNGEFEQDSQALNILKNQIIVSEELSIIKQTKELRINNIDLYFANLINSDLCE